MNYSIIPTIAFALLLSQNLSAEVPDFSITPQQSSYEGFRFAVNFEKQQLMHNQFESYIVAISISPGPRKTIRQNGNIVVWQDTTFVYSSSLQSVEQKYIPITLRQKITDPNAIIFAFDINPRYIDASWFNYQIIRNDGSVEMNCPIRLRDFISVPKAK
ncbi:MAG: hypothetical protein LLG06_01320 [Desulfobacteraceae bacterium]|nr:hypothetical protein [Desulfobacteraceae bacterium]